MSARKAMAFDIVIIGAGISGLVCGCVLAKAGMNVLIAEQHVKPGGYCASFRRGPFTFDAAAHCFGGYRTTGMTRQIFREIGLDECLTITKNDPSDRVITPDFSVSYWSDQEATIDEFRKSFPRQTDAVRNFFRFLISPDMSAFAAMRKHTFKDLMGRFFNDLALQSVLAAPLLGLGGLPPSRMSAFIGAKLFSEFLLDGGYHPQGGMQALPDALVALFKRLGGTILLGCPVMKINTDDGSVRGVMLHDGTCIQSDLVVSNADARLTYLGMLEGYEVKSPFADRITTMLPSISNFIAYLGLDRLYDQITLPGTTFCYFSHYDLDRAYEAIETGDLDRYGGHMYYVSREQPTILAIVPSPFKNRQFWQDHKKDFLSSFIERLEKYSIPGLRSHIVFQDAATPQTLARYTGNYHGASFGWAGTPEQLAVQGFRKCSFLEGLYLTGHWTTHGLGISGVTYVGYDTARLVLLKKRPKKYYF